MRTTGSAAVKVNRGVQVLNLGELKVTFSVGAERIVRKENGVTRQKI